jgi:hypothetical protein
VEEVDLEVGEGVMVLFDVAAWDEEDDTMLDVVDDETGTLELEREVDEVIVLLLTIGIAMADPARAARTKENEACIFDDG